MRSKLNNFVLLNMWWRGTGLGPSAEGQPPPPHLPQLRWQTVKMNYSQYASYENVSFLWKYCHHVFKMLALFLIIVVETHSNRWKEAMGVFSLRPLKDSKLCAQDAALDTKLCWQLFSNLFLRLPECNSQNFPVDEKIYAMANDDSAYCYLNMKVSSATAASAN